MWREEQVAKKEFRDLLLARISREKKRLAHRWQLASDKPYCTRLAR
jgi:hypothetical protein